MHVAHFVSHLKVKDVIYQVPPRDLTHCWVLGTISGALSLFFIYSHNTPLAMVGVMTGDAQGED